MLPERAMPGKPQFLSVFCIVMKFPGNLFKSSGKKGNKEKVY
jgi:hypothetical protein